MIWGCQLSNPTSYNKPQPEADTSSPAPAPSLGCSRSLHRSARTFPTMELRSALFLLCLAAPLCRSDFSSGTPLEPYDFLFDTAVEAYYRGDWLSVILNMEKALRNKATVRKVKADCRLSCANQTAYGEPLAGLGVPVPGVGSVEDLGFFQKVIKRADCVNSCETEKLGSPTLHLVSQEVELEFKKRTPYNYLQVAYFKVEPSEQAGCEMLLPSNAPSTADIIMQLNHKHSHQQQENFSRLSLLCRHSGCRLQLCRIPPPPPIRVHHATS